MEQQISFLKLYRKKRRDSATKQYLVIYVAKDLSGAIRWQSDVGLMQLATIFLTGVSLVNVT